MFGILLLHFFFCFAFILLLSVFEKAFQAFLEELNYHYVEETENSVYQQFLR